MGAVRGMGFASRFGRVALAMVFVSVVCAPTTRGADALATRTITLGLSADEAIPVLGLRPGHLTTVSFRDGAGASRAILGIEASTQAIDVVRMATHPHVATLRAVGRGEPGGNVVALIEGIDRPVHIAVAPKAPQALRVVVDIAGGHASADVGSATALPAAGRTDGELRTLIRDYLLDHPEVIREALDPARQLASKVAELRDEIVGGAGVPTAGDPAGAVTVVEFFDFRCGYCKSSLDAVRAAAAQPGVRVELRDYPILGPESERASRLALAAGLQGRYEEAHFALMERQGGFGPDAVADLAAQLGLDAVRLEADMESAEVTERIGANRALAERLGVTGTPAFLVLGPGGVEVAPGSLDAARMLGMIEAAN